MKVITIGRNNECSIVINDVKVSRVHAQLVQDDNGNISVVDLGSTNGTKVNGKRIVGEMRLNPGDELRVGDTVLPWQNYIATVPSQTSQPIASNIQSSSTVVGVDAVDMPAGRQPEDNKSKNTLLWIILAVVLGLLVAGGVAWLLLGRGSDASSTPTRDTIYITDTIPLSDSTELSNYEKYLLKIINDQNLELKRRGQTPINVNQYQEDKELPNEEEFNTKIDAACPEAIYFVYSNLIKQSMLSKEDSVDLAAKLATANMAHIKALFRDKWSIIIKQRYVTMSADEKRKTQKFLNNGLNQCQRNNK